MIDLTGKVALVTGAGRGIGRTISLALGRCGAFVVPTDTTGWGACPTGIAVTEAGGQALARLMDVTDAQSIEATVTDILATHGRLDILVNNAGIQHVAPIEEFPAEMWDAIIAINLTSAFHAIKAAFPIMKQQRFGRIINMASAHAIVASPFKSAYVAAKHGLIGLTKVAALEGAEHGITVNAICPGYVRTALVEKQIPDAAKAGGMTEEEVIRDVILAAQPTKEFVTVDQIAQLAIFLCGDGAASMTGAALPVDGGWTAR